MQQHTDMAYIASMLALASGGDRLRVMRSLYTVYTSCCACTRPSSAQLKPAQLKFRGRRPVPMRMGSLQDDSL